MSRRTGSSDVGKNRVGQIDTMTRPNRWTKVRRTEPPTGRPRQSYFGIFNTLLFSILNISYKGFYKLRGTMAHFVPLSVSPCPRIMCTQLLKIDFLLFVHAFSATTIWLYTSEAFSIPCGLDRNPLAMSRAIWTACDVFVSQAVQNNNSLWCSICFTNGP